MTYGTLVAILILLACYTLIPRPSPSFPSLAVWLSGRGARTFPHVSDITDRPSYKHGQSCESQTTSPTCIYWSATIPSQKIAAHKDDSCCFTR